MTADELQLDDEILVMDETGQFKVLSGGQLKSLDEFSGNSAVASGAVTGAEVPAEDEAENLKPILPIDTGMEEPMLQPPPPALYKQTSSFYFHPEDEEEAAKHQTGHFDVQGRKKYSLDKIAAKAAENYQLSSDPELFKRLRSSIFSFLRDRRSAVDTMDLLVRSQASGGLSFKRETADNLLEFLKEIKGKIEAQSGMVVDEKDTLVAAPIAGQFKQSPAVPVQPAANIKPAKKVLPAVKQQPLAGQVPVAGPEQPYIPPPVKISLPDLPSFKPKAPSGGSARFQRPVKEGEKRLTDVKKDYKLVGPVEELACLNLDTFRRLAATPTERAQKIAVKINLLAKDSLARKAQGINGWRQSPLYKMYVALGQASMEHSVDLAGVIREYTGQGKDILSLEEFNAITDLNKQLRF